MRLLVLLLALGLVSCSQGTNSSNTVLRIAGGLMTGNYHGMVYGRHSSGKSFAKKFDGTQTQVSLNLQNGSWEFALISWDNSDPDAYEGTAKCFAGTSTLDGGPVTINADMSTAGCSSAIFGGINGTDSNSGLNIKPVSFYNCLGDVTGVATFNEGCDDLRQGFSRSFHFGLAEYNDFTSSNSTAAYQSTCIDASTPNAVRTSALRFPTGDINSVFRLVVTSYDSAGCSGLSEASIVARGLRDPESALFTDQTAAQYIYFDDQGADELVLLSSTTYSIGNIRPKTPKFKVGTTHVYYEGENHTELFKTDLTAGSGAPLLSAAPIHSAKFPTLIDATLYFGANDTEANIFDYFSFDETNGDLILQDYTDPGAGTPPFGIISKTWKINSTLYYVRSLEVATNTKWQACSLTSGTETCFGPQADPNSVLILGVINGKLYIVADDAGTRKLFEVVGTTPTDISGTVVSGMPAYALEAMHYSVVKGNSLFAFVQGTAGDGYVLKIPASGAPTAFNNTVGLNLDNASGQYPLHTSDGKIWLVVSTIGPGEAPAYIDTAGNFVVLSPSSPTFSGANGVVLAGELNNKLLFYADADASVGYNIDLYAYTGTSNLEVVADHPDPLATTDQKFLMTSSLFYFEGNQAVSAAEPWIYDGTSATQLQEINSGISAPSNPDMFTAALGEVYFTADDGTTGTELWKTDGTAGGTVQVADIFTGSGSSIPERLMATENYLYFLADGGGAMVKLYRTRGDAASTVPMFGIPFSVSASTQFRWNSRLHYQLWDGASMKLHHLFMRPQ